MVCVLHTNDQIPMGISCFRSFFQNRKAYKEPIINYIMSIKTNYPEISMTKEEGFKAEIIDEYIHQYNDCILVRAIKYSNYCCSWINIETTITPNSLK